MSAVFVAGSLNMDVVAFASRLPAPGETISGDRVGFFPGGKGLNTAVAAAKQGADVKLIGKVGADGFGDQLFVFAEEAGIDVAFLQRVQDISTGTAIIVVADGGENSIVVVPGANGLVHADQVLEAEFGLGDVLLSNFEIPLPTLRSFFDKGHLLGARTILAPTPAVPCDFLDLPSILIFNETELEFFSGYQSTIHDPQSTSPPPQITDHRPQTTDALAALRKNPAQSIIVTLGAEGAIAITKDGEIRVPGRIVDAVDATGAGDCFVGSLAARLAAGDSLEEAMRYANVAASISVTRPGAAPSIPDGEEVRLAM